MSKRPLNYYAQKYGVPPALARVMEGKESGGRDSATSPKNAVGRLQIHLPSHPEVTEAQARDPDFNYDFGMKLLSGYKKTFGSWRLALAAYNAGPNAVRKYDGVPPYKETQSYVETILRAAGALTSTPTGDARAPLSPSGAGAGGTGMFQKDSLTKPDFKQASLLGLRALAEGKYDPTQALEDLASTVRTVASSSPPTPPPEAPPTATGDAGDDWQEWVKRPAPRQGPSAPHTDAILQFVGQIGRAAGQQLEPWGNESHDLLTVDGNPSAHGPGNAADIPAKGARLRRLGYLALLEAGMEKKDALKAARHGGLYNVGGYQIIFATQIGGNHSDHLHVGIRG